MTGILLITHAGLGQALIETAEFIMGTSFEGVAAVSIDIREDPNTLVKKIKNGIKAVNDNAGVIIFTDMFGGTPSNLSYSFQEEGTVEVMTGVNLPVLLKALEIRDRLPLLEMAETLVEKGRESISQASGILKSKKSGSAKKKGDKK